MVLSRRTYLVSAICIGLLKAFYIFFYGPLISFDAPNYMGFADQILGIETPYKYFGTKAIPNIQFRTAGYPLILVGLKVIFKNAYLWAAIILQSLLSVMVSLYLLRVSVRFLGSLPKAIFVMIAYATCELLMWDIFAQSDGVYTNLFVFFTLYALNNDHKNTVGHFLLLGSMFAYLFLIRDVTLYMGVFIFPALLFLHKKYVRRACVFLVPLIMTYVIYGSINKCIHGEFFISSSGQFVPVQALLPLAEKGVPVFEGESVVDKTMRDALQYYNLRDLYVYNELMLTREGFNPRQIDKLNKKKYFEALTTFPLEMTRRALKKFFEKFATLAFNPPLNMVEVSRAAYEQTWPKKWANVADVWDGLFYAFVNICRLLSLVIFAASLIRFFCVWKKLRDPSTPNMLWCYSIMAGFACVYCPTHIEARYLLTTIPFIVMTAFGFHRQKHHS